MANVVPEGQNCSLTKFFSCTIRWYSTILIAKAVHKLWGSFKNSSNEKTKTKINIKSPKDIEKNH